MNVLFFFQWPWQPVSPLKPSRAVSNDPQPTHHHGHSHGGAGRREQAVGAVGGGDDKLVEAASLVVESSGGEDLTPRGDGEGGGVRALQLVDHVLGGVCILRLSQSGHVRHKEREIR